MGIGLQGIGGIGGIGGHTSGMPTSMPQGGLSYASPSVGGQQQPLMRRSVPGVPQGGPSALGQLTSGLGMANTANKLYEGMGGAATGLGGGLGAASGALGAYGSINNIASGRGTPMDYVNLAKTGYNVSGMLGGGLGGAGGSGLSAAEMGALNTQAAQGLAGAGELSGVGGTAGGAEAAGAAGAGGSTAAAAMPMAAMVAWAVNDYNKGGETNNAVVNTLIHNVGGPEAFRKIVSDSLPRLMDPNNAKYADRPGPNFETPSDYGAWLSGGQQGPMPGSYGHPLEAPEVPYGNLFAGKYDTEMNQALGSGVYADLRKRVGDAQTQALALHQATEMPNYFQGSYTNEGG